MSDPHAKSCSDESTPRTGADEAIVVGGLSRLVLMVTHGIDEAILLADRIVVMANPLFPSVRAIIPVPIQRPRDRETIVADPAYARIQHKLLEILREDQLVAA